MSNKLCAHICDVIQVQKYSGSLRIPIGKNPIQITQFSPAKNDLFLLPFFKASKITQPHYNFLV